MLQSRYACFWNATGGNIAVITALSLTALTGIAGMAMLFAQGNAERTDIQGALDAGVLAGTALGFSKSDDERIAAAKTAFYRNAEGATFGGEDPVATFEAGNTVVPLFTVANARVLGKATSSARNTLGTAIGITEITVSASSQGEKIASDQICVLALNKTEDESLFVYGNGRFEAQNCAVQANSSHSEGMRVDGNKATARAKQLGVSGGYAGEGFTPNPITDVAPVEDPYASLPVPEPGSCIDAASRLSKVTATLNPGTYCGGLEVKAGAKVTLNPGIYIMKDGQFKVNSSATVTGEEVMIALVGKDSYIYLLSDANVTLTSPVAGTYKNIQFMSDRDLSQSKFEEEWTTILGGAVLNYDGVAYLPEQQLWVSGAGNNAIVVASSPTMTLVADKIWAQGNAVIELTREDKRKIGNDIGVASFEYGARLVR